MTAHGSRSRGKTRSPRRPAEVASAELPMPQTQHPPAETSRSWTTNSQIDLLLGGLPFRAFLPWAKHASFTAKIPAEESCKSLIAWLAASLDIRVCLEMMCLNGYSQHVSENPGQQPSTSCHAEVPAERSNYKNSNVIQH